MQQRQCPIGKVTPFQLGHMNVSRVQLLFSNTSVAQASGFAKMPRSWLPLHLVASVVRSAELWHEFGAVACACDCAGSCEAIGRSCSCACIGAVIVCSCSCVCACAEAVCCPKAADGGACAGNGKGEEGDGAAAGGDGLWSHIVGLSRDGRGNTRLQSLAVE